MRLRCTNLSSGAETGGRDWIATVNAWPSNFKWRSMDEVGTELSQKLRDPKGEHKCDILIALTHARYVPALCTIRAFLLILPQCTECAQKPSVSLRS